MSKETVPINSLHSIPQIRMEELATLFKDKIIEMDEDEAMEFFYDEACLTEEECAWFEIDYDEMCLSNELPFN